jgi:hypothetical protein
MNELKEKTRKEDPGRKKNVCTGDQKMLFIYFRRLKLLSVAAEGKSAGIAGSTSQTWAKKLKDDQDWDIFEKEIKKLSDLKPNYKKSISMTC